MSRHAPARGRAASGAPASLRGDRGACPERFRHDTQDPGHTMYSHMADRPPARGRPPSRSRWRALAGRQYMQPLCMHTGETKHQREKTGERHEASTPVYKSASAGGSTRIAWAAMSRPVFLIITGACRLMSLVRVRLKVSAAPRAQSMNSSSAVMNSPRFNVVVFVIYICLQCFTTCG